MRVSMVMHNKNPLDSAAHTKVLVVILKTLQARRHRRVFLRLRLFCASVRNLELTDVKQHNSPKGKVRQRVPVLSFIR
jgi:hypothetical protein